MVKTWKITLFPTFHLFTHHINYSLLSNHRHPLCTLSPLLWEIERLDQLSFSGSERRGKTDCVCHVYLVNDRFPNNQQESLSFPSEKPLFSFSQTREIYVNLLHSHFLVSACALLLCIIFPTIYSLRGNWEENESWENVNSIMCSNSKIHVY